MALTAADVNGTWYANANGYRITIVIAGNGPFSGTYTPEGSPQEILSDISINGDWLEFKRTGAGFYQWYRVTVAGGIFQGRFSHSASSPKPALTGYAYHATAWNGAALSNLAPVAFELLVNNNYLVRLHIDKTPAGALVGRYKIYSSINGGANGEDREYDVTISTWNGTNLVFTRNVAGAPQVYTGTVSGRSISGTFKVNGHGTYPWNGKRAEVIGYGVAGGLAPADAAARLASLRSRLTLLMMNGNPSATTLTSTMAPTALPTNGQPFDPDRDDNPTTVVRDYTMQEWTRSYQLTNQFDGSTITRTCHGYVAVPNSPPPTGGYKVIVSVNGHGGSAWQTMLTSGIFWAGDAFACKGYLVVSVDISHRSDSPVYGSDGSQVGDDPAHGNGPHPSIRTAALDTDWEESGERTWDVMRAVDLVLERTDVNASHVIITGISLGGETATIASAMDPRISMCISAGYSPDMGVMLHNGAHPCWRFARADIREYVDVSDFEAMIAPRPLVVETGKVDFLFSNLSPPYGGDKQVARRARLAYADLGAPAGSCVHYLHYDQHRYHVGDISSTHPALGVQATTINGPISAGDLTWQVDGTTTSIAPTLFDLVNTLLP